MALIAHYPLISNVKDSTMENNHGTATGAYFASGGKLGGYSVFSLVSDKIVIPHTQLLSGKIFGKTIKLSISVWVYPTAWVDYGCILSKMLNNSYSNTTVGIWQDSTGFKFIVGSNQPDNAIGSYAHITYKPALNAWYNLICILDGTNMIFYVNGTVVGSTPLSNITRARSTNSANIVIGPRIESVVDSGIRGYVADLKLFDHVLSTQELKEILKAKVVHYKFNDFYNNRIVDYSGYDRDITSMSGGFQWSEDSMVGKGSFDLSSGDCDLLVPYGNGINVVTFPHTISMWVKQTSDVDSEIFFSTNCPSGQFFYIGRINGVWDFGIQNSLWGSGVTPVVVNKWTHVCLVLDGTYANLYINGVFSFRKAYTSFSLASNFYIGHIGGGAYYWNGLIDDIRVYSSAFPSTDVDILYKQRGSLDENGMLRFERFSSSIGFIHRFYDNPFEYVNTTVDFVRNSIVRLTTTTNDPMMLINSTSSQDSIDTLSSLDTSVFKIFQFKYRFISGTAGDTVLFFENDRNAGGYTEDQSQHSLALNGDGNWYIGEIDLSTHPYWTDSPIRSLRFDYAGYSGVTIEFEFIRLCKNNKQVDFQDTGILEAKEFISSGGLNGISLWWSLDNTLDEIVDDTPTTALNSGGTPATFINKMGYDMSGSGSYIKANASKAPMGLGSLSFWVNIDSSQSWASTFYLISGFSSDNSFHWLELYRLNTTTLRLTYSTASGSGTSLDITNASTLFGGKSVHVCILYSDSNNEGILKVYVNANLIGSIAVASAIAAGVTPGDLYLMADNAAYYTKGKISDVRFYKKLLSDIDVDLLYNHDNGTSKNLIKQFDTGEIYVKGTFKEV